MNDHNTIVVVSTGLIFGCAGPPLIMDTDLAVREPTRRQLVETLLRKGAQAVAGISNTEQRHSTHAIRIGQES